MQDPVAWLVIEAGWEVVASDGEGVGEVREVVGDSGKDIFNGLAVTPGLLRTPKYVPAEAVDAIYEGRVELGISSEEFSRLDEHDEPPPSAEVRPG